MFYFWYRARPCFFCVTQVDSTLSLSSWFDPAGTDVTRPFSSLWQSRAQLHGLTWCIYFFHSFILSFLHSFIHSLTHSSIHELIHLFLPFSFPNEIPSTWHLFFPWCGTWFGRKIDWIYALWSRKAQHKLSWNKQIARSKQWQTPQPNQQIVFVCVLRRFRTDFRRKLMFWYFPVILSSSLILKTILLR